MRIQPPREACEEGRPTGAAVRSQGMDLQQAWACLMIILTAKPPTTSAIHLTRPADIVAYLVCSSAQFELLSDGASLCLFLRDRPAANITQTSATLRLIPLNPRPSLIEKPIRAASGERPCREIITPAVHGAGPYVP
ncbi:hypothetical protein AAFF_G00105840 [Aldrovandia affinis]|uniref:Uncharacterized protein n=1 Tax=Aldrovandia affinis TaxID=143900 RepID=A0AAD7T3A2_9TELE|nr:hypothetical protein AAFF_G00105840 [Aldrovandia affinis]